MRSYYSCLVISVVVFVLSASCALGLGTKCTTQYGVRYPTIQDEGKYTVCGTQLCATWAPDDDYPSDTITQCWYAIGAYGCGQTVRGWTSNGTSLKIVASGLNLQPDVRYHISVMYKVNGTCFSQEACTDGIRYRNWYSMYDDDHHGTVTARNDNGTSCKYTYDERWRLRQVKNMETDGDGITNGVLNYTVDGAGNRTHIWFNEDDGDVHVFGYDAVNRLTDANYFAWFDDAGFTYDWVGNRTEVSSAQYTYDPADRLTDAPGSVTYYYFGFGGLKSSSSPLRSYTYDPRQLLSTVDY